MVRAVEWHAAYGHTGSFGARCGGFAVDVGEDGGDVGAVLKGDASDDAGEEDGRVWKWYQREDPDVGHCGDGEVVFVEGGCLDGNKTEEQKERMCI
jgi:hypothetical protein